MSNVFRHSSVPDPRAVEAQDDLEDAEAADAARLEMAATGVAPVPWRDVKVELGLQ